MQKYILSVILLASSVQIFGQGLSFSVVVDPQISWMNSDSRRVERDGTNFGIGGGLVMDNYFQENYAFSTGLLIGTTGGTLKYLDSLEFQFAGTRDTLPAGTSVRYKMQYLTIPISLKLKSNEIGYIKFYAHLGINSHINLKATGEVPSAGINGEDIRDEVGFFTMSYFIAAGIEYSLGGNTALLAGVYWTSGIWDVTKNPEYRAHVSSIGLRTGVKF